MARSEEHAAIRESVRAWKELEPAPSPGGVRVAVTVAADAVALLVSAAIAQGLISLAHIVPGVDRLFVTFPSNDIDDVLLTLALIPYWLVILYVFGLYKAPGSSIRGTSTSDAARGVTAICVGAWILTMVFVMGSGRLHSHIGLLIAYWLAMIVTLPVARWITRETIWRRRSFEERVVIVGAGEVGHKLAGKIYKHPEYRVRLIGFVDDGEPVSRNGGPDLPIIGTLADLERLIQRQHVNRVLLAFSRARHEDFLTITRICNEYSVRVNIVPRLFEVLSSRAGVDDLEGIPLLDVAQVELSQVSMLVKRVFDLIVGGVVTILCLPLFALIAIAIKIDTPGPVFFRQERMGRNGKVFRIFKFRSMVEGAESMRLELAEQNEYSGPMFKIREDPRTTRLGAWLRKTSLDELPQLLNVMKGNMSLVGPRPLWIEEAKECRGWTKKRLHITPGITGLWQVMGRNDIPFDEMVKLDYFYVTGWSLGWDIRLLIETIPTVLAKRGAY